MKKFELTATTSIEELKAIPRDEFEELKKKYWGLGSKVGKLVYKGVKNGRNTVYDVWYKGVQNDKVWKTTLALLKKKYLGITPDFSFLEAV